MIVGITSGMSGVLEKVQAYLAYWEKKYKHIWEQDKEAYIRRWGSGRGTGSVNTPSDLVASVCGKLCRAVLRGFCEGNRALQMRFEKEGRLLCILEMSCLRAALSRVRCRD